MANPFGYGEYVPFGSSTLGGQTLVLTQWSPTVLRYARDALVFPQFLPVRVELGKGAGDNIRVPIFDEMAGLGTTALTEGTSITFGTQTVSSVSITVNEYGRGLSKPTAIDYFSNVALTQQMQQTLAMNFALTWNELARQIFHSSVHGAQTIASAGSVNIGTNLTDDSTLGTGLLTGTVVDQVYDHLKAQKVPKFTDGLYRWVANAKTFRALKEEAQFENLQLYNKGGRGIVIQELGAWKGFLFLETEESTANGHSYAFGQGVGAQAFSLPMEVRYEPDLQQDFGRLQGFAWYLIGGVGAALRDKGTYCLVVKTGTSL